MKFNQIIGHDLLKAQMSAMYRHDRLPHALMLVGPSGCGGLATAIAFASFLLCEQKQGEDSCGVCSNCRKNEKLAHPDVHFSYPVISGKSGNGRQQLCGTFLRRRKPFGMSQIFGH